MNNLNIKCKNCVFKGIYFCVCPRECNDGSLYIQGRMQLKDCDKND